jgi:hypothetical protein
MKIDARTADVLFLQIVAFFAIAGVCVGAAVLAHSGYAIPSALLGSLVSAAIGKWFGKPLWWITLHQAGSLPPPKAAELAVRALESLPPESRTQLRAEEWAKLERARVALTHLTDPPPPPPPPTAAA